MNSQKKASVEERFQQFLSNCAARGLSEKTMRGYNCKFEAPDCFRDFRLVAARDAAGDFHDRVVVNAVFCIDFFQNLHDEVSVVIINRIDKGFALTIRIEVPGDFLKNSPVKVFGNDLLVKGIDFRLHVVFQLGAVENISGNRVINNKPFALLVIVSLHTQLSTDIVGSIMVN